MFLQFYIDVQLFLITIDIFQDNGKHYSNCVLHKFIYIARKYYIIQKMLYNNNIHMIINHVTIIHIIR